MHAVASGEELPIQIGQRDAWYLPHGDTRRDLAGLEVRYQFHHWPVRIPRAQIIIIVLGEVVGSRPLELKRCALRQRLRG